MRKYFEIFHNRNALGDAERRSAPSTLPSSENEITCKRPLPCTPSFGKKFFSILTRRPAQFLKSVQPFTCAATSDIFFHIELARQRLPRYGTGARYGQSVSSMNLSMGVAAIVSRTFCPFLNVAMPVKLTNEPMPKTACMRAGDSPKQWNYATDFSNERTHRPQSYHQTHRVDG